MSSVVERLKALNITLPKTNPVAGNYAPYIIHDGLLSVSGQTCKEDGSLIYKGQVGSEVTLSDAIFASRVCALNVLAQVQDACGGDWNRIQRCIKLTVFVNSAKDFFSHPDVANGASDLIVDVLGERGIHTRAAVGAHYLPGNSAVEVDGLFAIDK
jgi:enamine deaminase RidA (YjgF/YER057c/UK114 family)